MLTVGNFSYQHLYTYKGPNDFHILTHGRDLENKDVYSLFERVVSAIKLVATPLFLIAHTIVWISHHVRGTTGYYQTLEKIKYFQSATQAITELNCRLHPNEIYEIQNFIHSKLNKDFSIPIRYKASQNKLPRTLTLLPNGDYYISLKDKKDTHLISKGEYKRAYKAIKVSKNKALIVTELKVNVPPSKKSLYRKTCQDLLKENNTSQEIGTSPYLAKSFEHLQVYRSKKGDMRMSVFQKFYELDAYQLSMAQEIPLDVSLKILSGCVKGLKHIHSKGFVHRDVKLDNLFTEKRKQGSLHGILGDFGSAVKQNSSQNRKTAAGNFSFSAPELIGQKQHTPQSDLYSFALLALDFVYKNLYTLTKHNIHQHHLAQEGLRLARYRNENPTKPIKNRKNLDFPTLEYTWEVKKIYRQFVNFLEKILNPDPSKRPSIDEVIQELSRLRKIYCQIPEVISHKAEIKRIEKLREEEEIEREEILAESINRKLKR